MRMKNQRKISSIWKRKARSRMQIKAAELEIEFEGGNKKCS